MYRRNLGDQIRDIVEDAVDSCNFSDLNNKIKNTADRAINEFNRSTQGFQYDNRRNRGQDRYGAPRGGFGNGQVPPYGQGNPNQGPNPGPGPAPGGPMGNNPGGQGPQGQGPQGFAQGNNQGFGPNQGGTQYNQYGYQNSRNRYGQAVMNWKVRPPYQMAKKKHGVRGSVSSVLFTILGAIGTIGFGITAIVMGALWGALGSYSYVFSILGSVFTIAAIASASVLTIGIHQRKRIRRYNVYDEIVGPNNYCEIKKLAEGTGKSIKYVIKDLKKMILLGYFKEGHIDDAGSCFMLSDQTYEQYLQVMENYKEREKQQAEKKQVEESQDPELKKAIEAGKAYIKQINVANEDIPGEEISKKLYLLEDIVSKVFVCVEKHPNKLSEIRKFMEYYLPITLKLVNAYKEFEAQPIQGDNIKKSKKEIEDTIDTINAAFEKLLDSLYEEEAMEVASDISVLNTLFAQEGLTKKDFDLK